MQNVYFRYGNPPNRIKTNVLRYILVFLAFVTADFGAMAQGNTVNGVVRDENSLPIPGVTVIITGTSTGSVTNSDGVYKIDVPDNANDPSLDFSFIGYAKQTVSIGGRSVLDIQLELDVNQLDEVVVTAFGIERSKKALGYSVTDVSSEAVSNVKEANLMNSLQGKVAGLTVTQTGSGLGGSSRILLRGVQTINGGVDNTARSNQPLIVVDGVPIDNTTTQQASRWGGVDYGSPISDINPDDVESISVLKGPNASALYGIRGGNGVILITTKKGVARKGIGVSVSSQTTVDIVNNNILPNWQNEYGQGSLGRLPTVNGLPETALTNTANWGPRMEGQLVRYPDGVVRPFVPQPNTFNDFYDIGKGNNTTVALYGGNEAATLRVSLAHLNNKGIVPNSHLKRYTVNVRGTAKLGDKVTVDAKLNYVNQTFDNRPNLADIMENVANGLRLMPRNFPLSVLRDNFRASDLSHIGYSNSAFVMNPYWAVNVHENQDRRDRIIASVNVNYQILDWLSFKIGANQDLFTDRRDFILPIGTTYRLGGSVQNDVNTRREINAEFLLTATKDVTENINLSASFGGNLRKGTYRATQTIGQGIAVPGIFRTQNTSAITSVDNLFRDDIQSLFGFIRGSYKGVVFLDVTGRNDWSSTLPSSNNSFFYPSVGLSFVPTEAFDIDNDVLTFVKLRGSWAESAQTANAFSLDPTVDLSIPNYRDVPLGTVPDVRPNSELKSVSTESIELGADVRLFENKIGIDFTWYTSKTTNQVINIPVTLSSGFRTAFINAGLVRNKGFEIALNANIFDTNGFTWDLGLNFSRNRNEVVELAEGVASVQISNDRSVIIEARPGEPYGNIVGLDFQRDDNGRVLLDSETRLPLPSSELTVLGNITPDWTGGINTSFGYKGLKLSATVDVRQGGDILSLTNLFGAGQGSYAPTLEGRAEWYASEAARVAAGATSADWVPTGGYVPDGVYDDDPDENVTNLVQNTQAVDPQSYWQQIAPSTNGGAVLTPFIYDASFVKLREVSLSYALPSSLLKNTPLTKASVSLVGRNLFYINKNTDGFDPESSYNNSNGIGIESASVPTTRTIGFNINFSF